MKSAQSVPQYIECHPEWRTELQLLRSILLEADLIETIKWGAPCYTTSSNKNIVGMVAFKNHVAIWFHQGVFLKDKKKVLINANAGVTKALRQIRFQNFQEIDADMLKLYVLEAIENEKNGLEIKPTQSKSYHLPQHLKLALDQNKNLKDCFYALTFGKQKEYATYIEEAKQEATKLGRIEKITPLILDGKSLYEKYK